MTRPAAARIDLDALCHNLGRARSAAPDSRVWAVIKADAYGHGALPCARALETQADGFAVASLEEALVLREGGIDLPVLLLEGFFEVAEIDEIAARDLDIVIHSPEQIDQLETSRPGRPLRIWLKIDSGMHRLGIAPDTVAVSVARLRAMQQVASIACMTHLACADEPDSEHAHAQIQLFSRVTAALELPLCIANSAAVLGWPQSHCHWVRPGIMLYGSSPFVNGNARDCDLRPVMNLESELIAVRDIEAGESVGYGASWQAGQATRMGVVTFGYGDGYPRHCPAGTPVLVNGQRVPLIGRVSMDLITLDLSMQPQARVGDPVRFWGEGLGIDEIARAAGTISYELLTGVRPRVPRVYL